MVWFFLYSSCLCKKIGNFWTVSFSKGIQLGWSSLRCCKITECFVGKNNVTEAILNWLIHIWDSNCMPCLYLWYQWKPKPNLLVWCFCGRDMSQLIALHYDSFSFTMCGFETQFKTQIKIWKFLFIFVVILRALFQFKI